MHDKRDSFNFDIVNYPFVQDSNIPENPAYGVYSSELISIVCACDTYADFKNRHDSLCLKLMRQGFRYKKLVKQLGKSKLKHRDIFTVDASQTLKFHCPLTPRLHFFYFGRKERGGEVEVLTFILTTRNHYF